MSNKEVKLYLARAFCGAAVGTLVHFHCYGTAIGLFTTILYWLFPEQRF